MTTRTKYQALVDKIGMLAAQERELVDVHPDDLDELRAGGYFAHWLVDGDLHQPIVEGAVLVANAETARL
jgi:hypothetical protein